MGDGNVVANANRVFLVGAVYHGAVLYVYVIADTDGMHIAADHGIEPYAAVVAHYNIAYNSGVFGYKCVFADYRADSFDGIYEWHVFYLQFTIYDLRIRISNDTS
jgi:hypothetical protein